MHTTAFSLCQSIAPFTNWREVSFYKGYRHNASAVMKLDVYELIQTPVSCFQLVKSHFVSLEVTNTEDCEYLLTF